MNDRLYSSLLNYNGCVMNASGALCMSKDDLDKLNISVSCAIVSKSCSLEPRNGNPQPRWFSNPENGISINSMGLPNLGYNFYYQYFKNRDIQKPKLMSIAGTSMNEALDIFKLILNEYEFPNAILHDNFYLSDYPDNLFFEFNMSCPNIVGKPQIGYEFDYMNEYLNNIDTIINTFQKNSIFKNKIKYGIKLPPYFDVSHFNTASEIINKYNVSFVTCINSIGNGLIIDTASETVVIKPKEGLGGIGGKVIKSTALANVNMMRKLLRDDIHIIGCGGIETGEDIFQHILAGADAVQIGTCLVNEGIDCFDRLNRELIQIMNQKGYQFKNNFKGKLKFL